MTDTKEALARKFRLQLLGCQDRLRRNSKTIITGDAPFGFPRAVSHRIIQANLGRDHFVDLEAVVDLRFGLMCLTTLNVC